MLRKMQAQLSNTTCVQKQRSGMQKGILFENVLDIHDCRVPCETALNVSCELAPFRMFIFAPEQWIAECIKLLFLKNNKSSVLHDII